MTTELYFLGGFLVFIATMLAIDLGIFNKDSHEVSSKEALVMSIVWVSLSLGFAFLLYKYGDLLHDIKSIEHLKEIVLRNQHDIQIVTNNLEEALVQYREVLTIEYLTGYVVEYALSVDNIFVIVMILTAFNVDKKNYHRVLFWGILGALIMRFIFIFAGSALINQFGWILYVFGAFLVLTGIKMFLSRNDAEEIDTENHRVVKWAKKFFPTHPHFEGDKFIVIKDGKRFITPLFIVLLLIEFTDVIFAVDSIPAIFAVTKDPYMVFFSNIFAILGLRSMFFLLVNIIDKFHYLKVGLSFLLVFIGVKMLAHSYLKVIGFETIHSLIIIISILVISVLASLAFPKKETIS